MYFTGSSAGSTNGQFSNINFDNVDVGLLFNNTQPYGVFISNLNIANAGNGVRHVGIMGVEGNSHVSYSWCKFLVLLTRYFEQSNQQYTTEFLLCSVWIGITEVI